jgi:hypothetical protein
MAEPIKKYDSNGNVIYYKTSIDKEYWYDENGYVIYYKNSNGYEHWNEFDEHYNILFHLNTKDEIIWKKYPIFEEYHNKILFK